MKENTPEEDRPRAAEYALKAAYQSTPRQTWREHHLLPESHGKGVAKSLRIRAGEKKQQVEGFGACFSELGWEALKTLEPDQRRWVLERLFAPEGGCRFTYCRMPVGANDFAYDYYSLNDTAGDLAMEHFSIERDHRALIPFIREALSIQPGLRIWASPWSPPQWMKVSGRYASQVVNTNWGQTLGHDAEDLRKASQLRDEPDILEAYARYFVAFVKAYAREGITIEAVHPQNEMFAAQIFPSCLWEKELLVRFLADYLCPAFEEAGLDTEIWAGTFNNDDRNYAEWVLNHPRLKGRLSGAGFQWKAKTYLEELVYPEGLKLMQTESECHNGTNNWETAAMTFDLLCHYFRAGVNAYMYWNLALDEWGLSQWGWRQNSLVSIHHSEGSISLNPDFQAMRHFSGLVDTGAWYLPVESDLPAAAFLNPDGSIIANVRNPSSESVGLAVELGNGTQDCLLEPQAFLSLRFEKV